MAEHEFECAIMQYGLATEQCKAAGVARQDAIDHHSEAVSKKMAALKRVEGMLGNRKNVDIMAGSFGLAEIRTDDMRGTTVTFVGF